MNTPPSVPAIDIADVASHREELSGKTWVDVDGLADLNSDISDLLGLLGFCAVADSASSKSHTCEVRARIRKVTAELSRFYLDSLNK